MFVTGYTQEGKTHSVFYSMVSQWVNKWRVLWIAGTKGADPYMRNSVFSIVYDLPTLTAAWDQSMAYLMEPRAGDTTDQFHTNIERVLDAVINWKKTYPDTYFLLVVDEAQDYTTKLSWRSDGLNRMINTMAGVRVTVIVMNPDHQSVPNTLFNQCSYFAMFSDAPGICEYYQSKLGIEFRREDLLHLAGKYQGLLMDKHSKRMYYIWPTGKEKPSYLTFARDIKEERIKELEEEMEDEREDESDTEVQGAIQGGPERTGIHNEDEPPENDRSAGGPAGSRDTRRNRTAMIRGGSEWD